MANINGGSIKIDVRYIINQSSLNRATQSVRSIERVVSQLNRQMGSLQTSTNRVSTAMRSTQTGVNRVSTALNRAGTSARNLTSVVRNTQSQVNGVTLAVNRTNGALRGVTRSATGAGTAIVSVNNSAGMLAGTFRTIGKLAFAAFSIQRLVQFTKSSIDLGSSLAEVQNVVDVTFGSMASDVNNFAKNSITQFGLSELSAKKYSSTIGAILKASGMTTDSAAEMGKSFTGLAGDLASFYNVDAESAFIALRGGLTGETEPLKKFGIVMTQANLQQYAMTQGITKTVQAMTEQEKIMLRYNYILNATKDVQGDFARTSGSWANQVQILGQQWNSFKAILGSFITNALLPIVKGLNSVLARLNVLGLKMQEIFGISFSSDGSGGLVDENESIAESYDAVSEASKKAQESTASFDKVVQLGSSSGSTSGGTSGGSSGGSGSNNKANGKEEEQIESKFSLALNSMKKKLDSFLKEKLNFPAFDTKAVLKNVKDVIGDIVKVFKEVGSFVIEIAFDFLGDIDILGIIEEISYALSAFSGLFSTVISTVGQTLKNFYDTGLSPIVEWIGVKLKDALSFAAEQLNKFGQWFTDNQDSIAQLGTTLGGVVAMVWDFIAPIGDAVWEVFKGTIDVITSIFTTFGTFILDNQVAVVGGLVAITAAVGGYKLAMVGLKLVDFIKNFNLLTISTKASAVAQGALNAVMSLNPIGLVVAAVAALTAGFVYLWKNCEGFKNGVIAVFEAIKTGVVEGLKFIVNSISTVVLTPINAIIGLINVFISGLNKIKVPDWVPGVGGKGINIPEIKKVEIPKLANGGIVSRETQFIAGERGAEAIVPLQNSQYTEVLANEIVNGIMASGISGGGDTINIENAYGDDRSMDKLAEKVYTRLKKVKGNRGGVSYA